MITRILIAVLTMVGCAALLPRCSARFYEPVGYQTHTLGVNGASVSWLLLICLITGFIAFRSTAGKKSRR